MLQIQKLVTASETDLYQKSKNKQQKIMLVLQFSLQVTKINQALVARVFSNDNNFGKCGDFTNLKRFGW